MGIFETTYNSTDEEEVVIPLIVKKSNVTSSIYSVDSEESPINSPNPFIDPEVANYYRDVYENCQYECRGLFDPELEWTDSEEKSVLSKLDKKAALFACIMFIGLQIDRGNLNQAVSDNMLEDLGLTTTDYNTANTLYYALFLLAEIPSQLVSKRLGPDVWIPIQMISWSVVAALQAFISGRTGFFITRALTAILLGGFIPTIILWLSYFYKAKELTVRLSWFWTTLSLVQILTCIFAFVILRLRGFLGWEGWRWLFIIEGAITLVIGIFSIAMLVPSAIHTKTWLTPKGWFNDRELSIVVNRVLRDDPTKGDMNNRQAITPKALFKAIMDYDLWPVYFIGLIAYVPINTITQYFTITLKNLGWSTLNVNLLTIPYNILHIIGLLGITSLLERLNNRSLVLLILPLYLLPLLAILNWWSGSMVNGWATWLICNLILGAPYIHAICVSWVSRNAGSIKTRSISAAMYNMSTQTGSVIAANIYLSDDAPYYRRGNNTLFWFAFALIPLLLATKAYYTWRNHTKEQVWSKMSPEERYWYIANTKDEGNKRLDFRFSL